MLDQQLYASEKLRELEPGRISYAQPHMPPPGKPALAPLARPVGRVLHRLGHRLESWAAPPDARELPEMELRGKAG